MVAKKRSSRRPQVEDRGEGGEETVVQTTASRGPWRRWRRNGRPDDRKSRTMAKVAKKRSSRRPQVEDRGEGGEEAVVWTTGSPGPRRWWERGSSRRPQVEDHGAMAEWFHRYESARGAGTTVAPLAADAATKRQGPETGPGPAGGQGGGGVRPPSPERVPAPGRPRPPDRHELRKSWVRGSVSKPGAGWRDTATVMTVSISVAIRIAPSWPWADHLHATDLRKCPLLPQSPATISV